MIQTFFAMFCASGVQILPLIFIIIGCLAISSVVSIFVYKKIQESKLDSAQKSANKILTDALNEAKSQKKEIIIEAKDEAIKIRSDLETEIKERRVELQKTESRLLQKEEFQNHKEQQLDKKSELLDQIKEELDNKELALEERNKNLTFEFEKITKELERVSKLSQEEAKALLINKIEDDAKKDAANYVREIEEQAKNDANKKAIEIITQAIQRCATDHTAEITVTSVALPSEEMKGRLIGREGRNIRALENATGVELIIDDTPDTVILSGFDPVRREIARISIEKLMQDGRIHPARIEEMVEKVKKSIENDMKETGENASYDADVHGLHPALTMLLGRLKYRTSYGQNVLQHSIEVAHLASMLASELGVDAKVAKRGGLLHDIGKAVDHEVEGTHTSIGVQLARKYKENEEVIHCIEAHHGEVEFHSIEAVLVQVADAISSSRPGARRESLENYIKRLENLENIANSFKGVEKSFAIQAGREVRIIVKPEEVSDDDAMYIARDVAHKIEQELEYPGQIKVNVIRETRKVDYAK